MKYELATDTWGKEELKAGIDVLLSGQYTMGEKVEKYEDAFATYVGADYGVMTNSGSSANLIMISTMVQMGLLQPGDEVIVPAVSWSTTYFPLVQYGLIPVFVDVDTLSFTMRASYLEAVLSNKTKAILFVTLLGNSSNLKEVDRFCRANDLFLLIDNCEGFGCKVLRQYKNSDDEIVDEKFEEPGSIGLMTTYSTFFSHHLQTMEGGMVVTDNSSVRDYLKSIRSHGWDRHLDNVSALSIKKKNDFYAPFNFVALGYNVRPTEISGAIGYEQLNKAGKFINKRRENLFYLRNEMEKTKVTWGRLQTQFDDGLTSSFGFGFILRKGLDRDKIADQLKAAGIAVRPIVAGNFLRTPVMKNIEHRVYGELSASDRIHYDGFFIGNDSRDLSTEIDYFLEVMDGTTQCQ